MRLSIAKKSISVGSCNPDNEIEKKLRSEFSNQTIDPFLKQSHMLRLDKALKLIKTKINTSIRDYFFNHYLSSSSEIFTAEILEHFIHLQVDMSLNKRFYKDFWQIGEEEYQSRLACIRDAF